MKTAAITLACMAALALAACRDAPEPGASNTAVMGGAGPPRAAASLPAPPVPRTSQAEVAHLADGEALAVWEQGGAIMFSHYTPARGWQRVQALEDIGGHASRPRIASNGHEVAMAIWQHTVGRIDSLRFSRYEDGKGWTVPDVMPGALPRPRQPGKTVGATVEDAAARIEVDGAGNVRAQWLSGFDEGHLQVSTYVVNEGWSRPLDVPVAAAR